MEGLVAYEIDDEEFNGDVAASDIQPLHTSNSDASSVKSASKEPIHEPSAQLSKSARSQLAELSVIPPGECDPKLQEKVANFIRIQRDKGRQVKSELRASRQYRNPDFLLKMVEAVGIQEAASNFPTEIFDPYALHKEDYYEALKVQWAQQQQESTENAQKRKATRQIEFTSGSSKQKTSASGKSREVTEAVQRARAIAAKQNRRWDSRPSGR